MEKIDKETFLKRCALSHPYPVGDEALISYYEFFKQYEEKYHSVRVLVTLMHLNEVDFEGHRVVIFDKPRLQQAYYEMGEDIPEAFAQFLFEGD